MVKIPTMEQNPFSTEYLLNNTIMEDGKRSQRLGMASLGEACVRRMWLGFRWAREGAINRRVKRIFEFGNACETIVVDHLTQIGITVTDQQLPVNGWGGHIFGFIDGIAIGVPEAPKTKHLLEIKSMNAKGFSALRSKKVKAAQPKHYTQMQMYMGRLQLTRALYVVINKDTSECYVERVHFNEGHYKEYMSRAIDVVSHESIPPNLIGDPNNFTCKFCPFTPICYEDEPLMISCRSCANCDIENDGKWSCSLTGKQLTYDDQVAACVSYKEIEA